MNDFLFVCTVNFLRSPTAEHVARRMGFSADSAGTSQDSAIRPLTVDAIDRAFKIICMEYEHMDEVLKLCPDRAADIFVWDIPDNFEYCQPELIAAIEQRLKEQGVRQR